MSEPIKIVTVEEASGMIESIDFDPGVQQVVTDAVKRGAWHGSEDGDDPWVDGYLSSFVTGVLLALNARYELLPKPGVE